MARLISNLGCIVAGVGDIKGCVYDPQGLDISDLLAHSRHQGSVMSFPNATTVNGEEFLQFPCDILVPSATEGLGNSDGIKGSTIVEAAKHPIYPAAGYLLNKQGVAILPDIRVNAERVVVSDFEWAQNIQQFR